MAQSGTDQEVHELGGLIRAELTWLAGERRSWDEIGDAWRANPAAPVFEDVARWTARCYARSVCLCLTDLDDKRQPLLRTLLKLATGGRVPELVTLQDQASADLDVLRALVRRVRAISDGIVVYSDDGPIARDQLFSEISTCLDELMELANRYLIALGRRPVTRPSRRFYPNGMMRRPWLAADWRPCLFPARADIERAGESWPILDFISERDHRSVLEAMDEIIERLRDRTQWMRSSPIRETLEDMNLPSTDACVQLVKDQLFARGMDWRPSPPPIPPPVD